MEKSVKCVICHSYFDNGDHIPHLLPCLHSYCLKCLTKVSKDANIKCPECKEFFRNDSNGNVSSKFPIDTLKMHMADFYQIRHTSAEFKCHQCSEKAVSRCRECEEFLCEGCTAAHRKTTLTKKHSVMNLEGLRTSSSDSFHSKMTCVVLGHEEQPLSFFCISKACNRPVCGLCVLNDHKHDPGKGQYHDVKNINDVYVENKRLLEGYLIHLKQKKASVDDTLGQLKEKREDLKQKNKCVERELEECFQSCVEALERRKAELKSKIHHAIENNELDVENYIRHVQEEKIRLEQACKFAEENLKYSDAACFLTVKDPILDRVNTLSKDDIIGSDIPKIPAMKFVPRGLDEDFRMSISDRGELWATSAFLPKTKVETIDVPVGKEKTALVITLKDHYNKPLEEGGIQVSVTVLDTKGKTSEAKVIDCVKTHCCYKALFHAKRSGEYRAVVKVCGTPLNSNGYPFRAKQSVALFPELTESKNSKNGQTPRTDDGITNSTIQDDQSYTSVTLTDVTDREPVELSFPDINFDERRCNIQNEVSEDRRQLSNQKLRRLSSRISEHAFQNYRGTISTIPLGQNEHQYFEVQINLFIKRQLRQELMFEIGLSRKSYIDKHYTVDCHPFAWAFCVRRCSICQSLCLQAWHDNAKRYHTSITDGKSPGTTFKGIYGFLLDAERNHWGLIDTKSGRCMFRFTNVDTSKPLWPTFGIYNSDLVNVTLTLRTGEEIQQEPEIPRYI